MAGRKGKKRPPLIEARDLGIKFRTNRQRPVSVRARETFTAAGRQARSARGPDEFWALRNISFSIAEGEAVGLVGRNGHGKSTLLRMIAGVMIQDEGVIKVRGQVAPMIEVTGGFVGDLTVRDNIWLAAGLKGLTKRQIAAKFDDIVEWAEIGHRLDTPLRHLSSGMKAKVGFSVITSIDRPIVLVDEVLSVGDRAFRQKCFQRMEDLRVSGKTIVLVSHQESQIERFCKRALYLRFGELVDDGPVPEVLAHYVRDVEEATGEGADREREDLAMRARKAARRAKLEGREPGAVPAQSEPPRPETAGPDAPLEGQLALDVDVEVEERPIGDEAQRSDGSRAAG